MKKLFISSVGILAIAIAALLLNSNNRHTTNEDKAEATVSIVRMDERSGGTGVILSSGHLSTVLTNGHVCEVVRHGGLVITDKGTKHPVYSFQKSTKHDLCLITVAEDLGINTDISPVPPSRYRDAIIAGHPSLLPTIITKGHYSGRVMGAVQTGMRKCTEDDLHGPNGFACIFLGGIPVVQIYEMQVVSATIKPGSSGSAIYNEFGQLTNLVFAGAGELGYALAVPYEYVVNFLTKELGTISPEVPNFTMMATGEQESSNNCSLIKNTFLRGLCNYRAEVKYVFN